MYGKIGKKQDQDKLLPQDHGQQEADFGGIGNEALTHYLDNDLNFLHAGFNKANNGNEGGQEPEEAAGTALTLINEIAENEADNGNGSEGGQKSEKAAETALTLINEIAEKAPDAVSEITENKADNRDVPEDIAAEGLENYYSNDLNRLVCKTRNPEKKHRDSGNIMNDDLISEKGSEKEPDLLSVGSRRSSFSMKNGIRDDLSENSDLEEAGNDMGPVDGWDFAAQKLDPKSKPSFWKKLGSAAAYYGGKTVGKIGGILATLFNLLTFGKFTGIGSWTGLWKGTFARKRDYQRARNRKAIPGWDGAQFEKRSKYQIDIDFRRVPDIWSYPIAEDPMDGEGKEKPPVISVHTNQVSRDLTLNEEQETGHSGIGIEFNRKNPRTGELERYGLRYGYYLGGGLTSISANAVSNYNNANLPGQLRNEKNDAYTVSRRFNASARQVNAILNASEKYPDKGYNPYTRNCTTFVRDMVVDAANIREAAPIFEKADVNMPGNLDRKMFGAGAMAPLFKAEMENVLDKQAHRDDMNYQGFGNKMVTKADYDRYKKSLKLFTLRPSKAHSPNASAENIRRLEGPGTGEIGAFPMRIKDAEGGEVDSKDTSALNQSLMASGAYIKNLLTEITPGVDFEDGNIPDELQRIIDNLERLYMPMLGLLARDKDLVNTPKKDIRTARTKLSGYKSDLNKLLFKYYKNDRRLHDPVVNTIGTLDQIIYALDVSWRKKSEEEEKDLDSKDSDLGNIRYKFYNEQYLFMVKGKKLGISPSRYESLLQVYKSPKTALEKYLRFIELYNKGEENRDADEEKELSKLMRVRELIDSFDESHRYMLEKEEYSQQDVDYAFALGKKERKSEGPDDRMEESAIFSKGGNSASDTYKLLIMQKIFSGMKNRLRADKKKLKDYDQVIQWLEQDTLKCIEQSPYQMKMVIRGIKRSLKDPDEKEVQDQVFDVLKSWYIRMLGKLLKTKDIDEVMEPLKDTGSPLYQKIESMTEDVMGEANEAPLNGNQERIRN